MTITDAIARLREARGKAAKGPWHVAQDAHRGYLDSRDRTVCTSSAQLGLVPSDLEFLALAANIWPALMDVVEKTVECMNPQILIVTAEIRRAELAQALSALAAKIGEGK